MAMVRERKEGEANNELIRLLKGSNLSHSLIGAPEINVYQEQHSTYQT